MNEPEMTDEEFQKGMASIGEDSITGEEVIEKYGFEETMYVPCYTFARSYDCSLMKRVENRNICQGVIEHCMVGEHCIRTDDTCAGTVRAFVRDPSEDWNHPPECCTCNEVITSIYS